MKILITGTDDPSGEQLAAELGKRHDVLAVCSVAKKNHIAVDLGDPDQVAPQLAGVGAVVHALPLSLRGVKGDQADQHLLDDVSRGTYVLTTAAANAGVPRLVLISKLDLFTDYPEEHRVSADWRPLPRPEPDSLALYSAELVCREIARAGRIEVKCLRFGELGKKDGTTMTDAVAAIEYALAEPPVKGGHHWELRHVVSGGRFANGSWQAPEKKEAV